MKRTRSATTSQPSGKAAKVAKVSLRISRGASKLQRLLNRREERKYIETAVTAGDMSASGIIGSLIEIAEGTDFNERVGRKIRLQYIQYDLFASNEPAVNNPYEGIFHIVLDRQPNNAVPAYGDVIDITVAKTYNGHKNVQLFEERFKILQSFPFYSSGNSGEAFRARGFIDLSKSPEVDQVVHYNGSALGTPNTNNLLLLYASNEPTTGDVLTTWMTRVVYTDM